MRSDFISQLRQPEALLIFGPGEAKLELEERLSRSKTFSERTVDIETADKLTDPQIVARVKEHFPQPMASRPCEAEKRRPGASTPGHSVGQLDSVSGGCRD